MQGSWYQDAAPNYTKIVRNTNMSSFPNTYIFPHPHGSSNNFTNSRHQEINLSLTCTLLIMSEAWMPISRMQPLWSHFPKLHVHVDMTNILLTFTLSKKVVDAVGNLKWLTHSTTSQSWFLFCCGCFYFQCIPFNLLLTLTKRETKRETKKNVWTILTKITDYSHDNSAFVELGLQAFKKPCVLTDSVRPLSSGHLYM